MLRAEEFGFLGGIRASPSPEAEGFRVAGLGV